LPVTKPWSPWYHEKQVRDHKLNRFSENKSNFGIVIHIFNEILCDLINRLVGGIKNTKGLHLLHFEELAMMCRLLNQAIHLYFFPHFLWVNHYLLQDENQDSKFGMKNG